MNKYKLLSLDESGKASYNHPSKVFVLSGVVIPESLKAKIDIQTRKLKKKYFRDEDIVFHSRDMYRKKGPFSLLQNTKIETGFWSEFVSLINNPDINLFFVITNKINAQKANWQSKTILNRSYLKVLEQFSKQLKIEGLRGRIITESEATQNLYLIQAHSRVQSMGTEDGTVIAAENRHIITSLSLVNKSNQDIDIQIADALAAIAGMKYRIDVLKEKTSMNKMEQMKKRLIDRKLADKRNLSLFEVLI